MANVREVYKCDACGNIIEVLHEGAGELVCCGQPMANTGCNDDTAAVARRLVEMFADYDAVVCPSGSCTAMIRHHYSEYFPPEDRQFQHVTERVFELCEFLHDELKVEQLDVRFPHRVSIHQSCHGLRELRLGTCSESMTPRNVVSTGIRAPSSSAKA